MTYHQVINADCLKAMADMPDNSVDLTVTSPPYDNLRDYKGYSFDFEVIAKELYRITKDGGVLVWVVGDATINGSETGTSFRQALYFKDVCGFNLHDTMIYYKHSAFPATVRYEQCFEYMFVFSKGKPKTFNPLEQLKSATSFGNISATYRQKDGSLQKFNVKALERLTLSRSKIMKKSENIWYYTTGYMNSTTDKEAFQHPAVFPERLARDHILTWSNEGDTVLDCFMGSGTTGKMAILNNRNFIGIEISEEYCKIAEARIKNALENKQETLF